jgi:pentose-5-phosphate-3-epimerase
MDDLTVVGDTLLVTDWQNGGLFQIDFDGNLIPETMDNIFAQPSSVIVAGPSMFDQAAILVTERYTGDGLWVLE